MNRNKEEVDYKEFDELPKHGNETPFAMLRLLEEKDKVRILRIRNSGSLLKYAFPWKVPTSGR